MRILLLLALLLYNVITNAASPNNYDYVDAGVKRHYSLDDRRNWRKKVLMKSFDTDRDFEDRKYEHEHPKYYDNSGMRLPGMIDRPREMDSPPIKYNGRKHYDERDKLSEARPKSIEMNHANFAERGDDKRPHSSMNCAREHERYEACFAGCAAITCDNPRERLRPCYPFCEPGCICIHPYVRDDRTHKCVLPDECSKGLKGIPDLGDDI